MFSIKEAFRTTFKIARTNIICVFTLPVLYAGFDVLMIYNFYNKYPTVSSFISPLLQSMILLFLANMCLRILNGNGDTVKLRYYFSNMKRIFRVMLVCFTTLITTVMILAALMLMAERSPVLTSIFVIFMVVGICCLVCKYGFFDIRMLENGDTFLNAIGYSRIITIGNRVKIFLFFLMGVVLLLIFQVIIVSVCVLVLRPHLNMATLLSMATLDIMIFVTKVYYTVILYPFSILMKLSVYKQLSSSYK